MLSSRVVSRIRPIALLALAAAVGVASCSDSANPSVVTEVATPDERGPGTTLVNPANDGVMRIGVLIPTSGTAEAFGRPLLAGVDEAIAQINAAGGVNGVPVEIRTRDEGTDVAAATAAARQLIDEGIDAMIGPASSRAALAIVPEVTRRRVPMCSPTASATALTDIPDNNGLFVRTIASDEVEMRAMAELVDDQGRQSASILSSRDEYGDRLLQDLSAELLRQGIAVTTAQRFSTTGDGMPSDVAAAIAAGGVLVVLGTPATAGPVLNQIRLQLPEDVRVVDRILLSSALRDEAMFKTLGEDAGDFLTLIRGLSPQHLPKDPALAEKIANRAGGATAFAANAYDCVVMAALAASTDAELPGDSLRPQLTRSMIETVQSGSRCFDYAQCLSFLADGSRIDYDGLSGDLDLDVNGDRRLGEYLVYEVTSDGRDTSIDTIAVQR